MSGSLKSNERYQAPPLSHSVFVRPRPNLRLSAASLHSPVLRVFRVRRQRLSLQALLRLSLGFSRISWRRIVPQDRLVWFAQIHRFAEPCFVLILPPTV